MSSLPASTESEIEQYGLMDGVLPQVSDKMIGTKTSKMNLVKFHP